MRKGSESQLGPPGGSVVGEIVDKLENDLAEYFGALNELRQGATIRIPQVPETYAYYLMVNQMEIPLVGGGVFDQPNIWLQQYKTCQDQETIWKAVENRAAKPPSEPSPALRAVQDRIAGRF